MAIPVGIDPARHRGISAFIVQQFVDIGADSVALGADESGYTGFHSFGSCLTQTRAILPGPHAGGQQA